MPSTRLTKKCFEVIDRAEIRRIAMLGMGMPPKEAYCLDHGGIVSWVYSNSKEFAAINIAELEKSKSGKSSFRPGVTGYLVQLQKFIQKDADKPSWPPEGLDVVVAGEEAAEAAQPEKQEVTPDEQENVVMDAPVTKEKTSVKMKKKTLRKKKSSTTKVTVDADNEQEVPEAVAVEAVATSEETDKVLGTVSPMLKQVNRIADRMDYVSKALSEIKQKSFERYDEQTDKVEVLSSRIDTLDKTVVQLANALLFVVNTACLEDSVATTLDDIPTPDNY